MVPDKCTFPALVKSTHCLIAPAEARTAFNVTTRLVNDVDQLPEPCLYYPRSHQ